MAGFSLGLAPTFAASLRIHQSPNKISIMTKPVTEHTEQPTHNRTQQGLIGIACLAFFPLVYLIGTFVMSLIQ